MQAPAVSAPRGRSLPAALLVALLLGVYGAVWVVELSLTSLTPPVDNIEQLVWMRSLEWGYHKHPPLTTWLMWLATRFLPLSATTSYLLGAAITLLSFAVFWELLRERRGTPYANLTLLAGLCITYYNGRLNYYNHNVVLLLAVVTCAACAARAFERRQLRWWAATGLVVGLGALAKYQIVVCVASLAGMWLTQRGWRDAVHVRGALIAMLLALALVSPHLAWSATQATAPIQYAMESSLGAGQPAAERIVGALGWAADQLFNRALPAWLLLGSTALWISRRAQPRPPPTARSAPAGPARSLILWWGVLPFVLMPAVGLVFGSKLQMHWGTPFLLFVVPAAMEMRPACWEAVSWRVAGVTFAALQSLLLLVNVATSPIGLHALRDNHWRTYPSKRIADEIADAARSRLGGPIRVVSGSVSEAGALMLELPEHPLVVLDGRYDISPWVSPELVARCGALELLTHPGDGSDVVAVGAVSDRFWRVVLPAVAVATCP